MPSTLGRLALTGKTVPPKGWLTRFHSRDRPTLFGASLAPITATFAGAKKNPSGWPRWWRISWAGSPRSDRGEPGGRAGFAALASDTPIIMSLFPREFNRRARRKRARRPGTGGLLSAVQPPARVL